MSPSSAPRSTDPGDVMLASRLTVVRDEIEAETICGLLRTEGIACDHRQTDMGAGAWEVTAAADRARSSSRRAIWSAQKS